MIAPLNSGEARGAAPASAESRVPPPSGERDRMVRAEQIKLLYAKAPMAIMATLVNAPLLVYTHWDIVKHGPLIAWLTGMFLLSMAHAWLTIEYRRASPSPLAESRWGTWYLIGIALAGIGWGSAGIFLGPQDSLPHQVFLSLVLAGMTAGAVAACSAAIVGFLLFALPALLPFAAQCFFAHDSDFHLVMGAMTALYLVLMVFLARTMHETILTSLNLRYENRDLVAYLGAAKGHADRLNDELTFEINERKRAHKERERLITELQDALANIKVLRGLLPICSHCKKIRGDEGDWHAVEVFVRDHSEADFSHSICPECLNKMYPEFGKNILPD
jgi:hypothetical protein